MTPERPRPGPSTRAIRASHDAEAGIALATGTAAISAARTTAPA
jgi:hypothetical protein